MSDSKDIPVADTPDALMAELERLACNKREIERAMGPAPKREAVNHPAHYGGDTTYEAIKVIEAWELGFCLGNCVKYVARAGKKDPTKTVEDLEKARWYLDRAIARAKEGK